MKPHPRHWKVDSEIFGQVFLLDSFHTQRWKMAKQTLEILRFT